MPPSLQLRTLENLGDAPRARLERNLRSCRDAVADAALRAGRDAGDVLLLVVSKYVDADVVRLLWELGVRDFGENRVQQALPKIATLDDLEGARFHFIGHLQRNKARRVIDEFQAFHALDSERLARELETRLEARDAASFDLWVEVNISGEAQKTGLTPDALPSLLEVIAESPTLAPRCRGLMGMARYDADPENARPAFRTLRRLRDDAVGRGLLPADAGLSMGMSADFEVAIEEGATVVRVGSALYEAS